MTSDLFTLRVECYSDHRGEEIPRRFNIGQRDIKVIEVIDRWLAPTHRYFKVKGNDEGIYILRHDETRNLWELTMYEMHR